MTSVGRPYSAAVAAVIGPMEATATRPRQALRSASLNCSAKFRAVDELVNVTASTAPDASAARSQAPVHHGDAVHAREDHPHERLQRGEGRIERLPRRRRLDHDRRRLQHAGPGRFQELGEPLRLGARPGDDDRPALERPLRGPAAYSRHDFPGCSGAIEEAPWSSSDAASRRPRRSAPSVPAAPEARKTLRPSSLATSAVILISPPAWNAYAATGELHEA